MAKKLPPGYKYQERELKDWNAASFRAYMQDKHEELFGIKYVTRNVAMENKMIKTMYQEYGKEATKEFIDRCMDNYKPSKQYPGINFAFMYSYLKDRYLPQILAEIDVSSNDKDAKGTKETKDYEKLADLL